MIIIPVNPNLVHIPMIQTGCMKSEFDSTYPIRLNGIIHHDEFQQSITNISRTVVVTRIPRILFGLVIVLCILTGFTLCIAGGATLARMNRLPVLLGLGFGTLGLTLICLLFGCPMIQSSRINRMRRAVAEESMKYSMRSPTPCSWQLNVNRRWYRGSGGRGGGSQHITYRLDIEIGQNAAIYSSMFPPQPISYFPRHDNIPPPAYAGSGAGFCPQCGIPRQVTTTNFCYSCGQQFDKY